MAEAVPQLRELIANRNVIRFDGNNRNPLKPAISTADLPELALAQAGFESVNYNATSSSTEIVQQYLWAVTSGDYRITLINSLKWLLVKAMSQWRSQLTTLTWGVNAYPYVKNLRFRDADEGDIDSERLRNIDGWTWLANINVQMRFQTTDLEP